MKYGVVAGKFWPLHKGHAYLLRYAARNCDHLDILLVGRPGEFPAPSDRALAIYEELASRGNNVKVHIVGDINTDDGTEESSQMWAKYTQAILGYYPDIVFSSEEYGVRWAGYMHAVHDMVDLDRKMYPTSGTMVRNNLTKHYKYLPPATNALVIPRVVVLGAESSGTTTLAKALGREYSVPVVPEFGRNIAEQYKKENGVAPPLNYWSDQVFRLIAHGQNAMEEQYARWSGPLLICDTDSLATAVWYERYHNQTSSTELDRIGLEQSKKHSLYIITDYSTVPWEDDGTRDGKNERQWMQESFEWLVKKSGVPYILVEGSHDERMEQAISAVESHALDRSAYDVVG